MDKASRSHVFSIVIILIISCGGVMGRDCNIRSDCNYLTCDQGLPTCIDGHCLCLILNTKPKGQSCKKASDCQINCWGGEPFCVDGHCVCT
nr:defensin-like protein 295 isoform X1 [Solanum lycopersicum]